MSAAPAAAAAAAAAAPAATAPAAVGDAGAAATITLEATGTLLLRGVRRGLGFGFIGFSSGTQFSHDGRVLCVQRASSERSALGLEQVEVVTLDTRSGAAMAVVRVPLAVTDGRNMMTEVFCRTSADGKRFLVVEVPPEEGMWGSENEADESDDDADESANSPSRAFLREHDARSGALLLETSIPWNKNDSVVAFDVATTSDLKRVAIISSYQDDGEPNIRLWSVDASEARAKRIAYFYQASSVKGFSGMDMSSDGSVVVAKAYGGALYLMKLNAKGKVMSEAMDGNGKDSFAVRISPDGKTIVVDKAVRDASDVDAWPGSDVRVRGEWVPVAATNELLVGITKDRSGAVLARREDMTPCDAFESRRAARARRRSHLG